MSPAPTTSAPDFQPKRLARYALAFPAAILAWVFWQLLLARLFFGGAFQPGLSWVEATGEALFILVVGLIAPGRKRALTAVSLAFFVCRDIATAVYAPTVVSPMNAVVAIGLAALATAFVWARAKS